MKQSRHDTVVRYTLVSRHLLMSTSKRPTFGQWPQWPQWVSRISAPREQNQFTGKRLEQNYNSWDFAQ